MEPIVKKEWFIDSKQGNIKDEYYFEKKLGSGGYGAVYLAKNKKTGAVCAVKAIQKGKVQDYESFLNEIAILKNLDHPNIIKLYETWETDRICFLITDLCEGGELFYYITRQKHLTEHQAATIMKQAFSALKYLHENKICHRDIKPENFLLYKENDISCIKLIDFGLSKQLTENELMNTPNGTPYYIAPEVLKGNYNNACDNWSMGVVLYIMLCGKPPFGGKNNTEILKNVVKGAFSFDLPAFEKCTDLVKELIQKLLVVDPNNRFSAEQAFSHKWIQDIKQEMDSNIEIGGEIADGLKEYMDTVQFKKTTLTFLASKIPENQIESLRDAFIKIDKNGDGTLTKDELKIGVKAVEKCGLSEEDFELAMKLMDTNGNGVIDYTEFIAACVGSYGYIRENQLKHAFEYFDKDGSGKITAEELKDCLCGEDMMLEEGDISKIIAEVDKDNDGAIDYTEFIEMMKNNTQIQGVLH